MGDAQDRRLVERLADDLQAHWQAIDHARRDADAGQTGQARRNREQVIQVHGQRILGLGAERERDCRAGRPDHGIVLVEDRVEVLLDQRADLLRLHVVGIVVARRQRIRAQDNAPLHLAPKVFPTRTLVDIPERIARFAQSCGVFDPVVARQVGAGLGWGDQVVGGQAVLGVRQADFAELGAQALQMGDGLFDRRLDARLHAFDGEVLARQRQADALQAWLTVQRSGVVGHFRLE